MRWLMGVVVALALVGIGASVGHYLVPPYNPGFREHPVVTALHVGLGAAYLALAPVQFVRPIRARWPRCHRRAGRVLVAIGLVIGVTALVMGLVFPTAGDPERVVIGAFGGFFLVALVRGFPDIRARRAASHREWMIRVFAIGLSIATMRLIFIPTLIVVGNPTDRQIEVLSVGSFTIAFVIHALIAEVWIRRTRVRVASSGGARPASRVGARTPAFGLSGGGEGRPGR